MEEPGIDIESGPCNEFGVSPAFEKEIKKMVREHPDHFRQPIPPYDKEYPDIP